MPYKTVELWATEFLDEILRNARPRTLETEVDDIIKIFAKDEKNQNDLNMSLATVEEDYLIEIAERLLTTAKDHYKGIDPSVVPHLTLSV